MRRLDARTPLPAGVAGPGVRPDGPGIVHLGVGAFHRAHQAAFTQDAIEATGDRRWGILGVTQRSDRVVRQLRPQDGLYGVLTLGPTATSLRVVGSVVDVADGRREAARVVGAIAAPTTHLVTLTVTEQGYAPDGPTVALLAAGLRARWAAGGAPLTVLSCDNLTGNGRVLGRAVRRATAADADAATLQAWIDRSVTFPSSMVDRIVPATTPEHHRAAEELLLAHDEALVAAEPFGQWVIEDRFAGPRPAWDQVGATLTADVGPFEEAKLRLLNGTHTLLACAGLVRGHATIADAVGDPVLLAQARALQAEAIATLEAPPGVDLGRYAEDLLVRFANPATGHRTAQVASASTSKIPQRWSPAIRALGDRARPDGAETFAPAYAAALGAWVAAVVVAVAGPAQPTGVLDDPQAAALRAAGSRPLPEATAALLALPGLLPDQVRTPAFGGAVERAARDLLGRG